MKTIFKLFQQRENKEKNIKNFLIDIYIDYVNNYLTVGRMSQDYQMSEKEMELLITTGRRVNNY